MRTGGRPATPSGAARLDFLDLLTAAILLAVLLYAAWKQFPAFNNRVMPAPAIGEPAPSPGPAVQNH